MGPWRSDRKLHRGLSRDQATISSHRSQEEDQVLEALGDLLFQIYAHAEVARLAVAGHLRHNTCNRVLGTPEAGDLGKKSAMDGR